MLDFITLCQVMLRPPWERYVQMFKGALGAAKRALHRRMCAVVACNDDAAHLDIGKESLMMSRVDVR